MSFFESVLPYCYYGCEHKQWMCSDKSSDFETDIFSVLATMTFLRYFIVPISAQTKLNFVLHVHSKYTTDPGPSSQAIFRSLNWLFGPSLQAPETENKLKRSDQFLTNVTEDLSSALLAESFWWKIEVKDSAGKSAASCHLDSFDSTFEDQICPKLFHLQYKSDYYKLVISRKQR